MRSFCQSSVVRRLEEPETAGMERAYVLINCRDGYELEVRERLKSIQAIKTIGGKIGSYDIITKIEVPSLDDVGKSILSKIRRIPMVRSARMIC